MTAEVTAYFVEKNGIAASELPALIERVFGTLEDISKGSVATPDPHPATPVRKSVTDDYLICLEDGLRFQSLKRHLMSQYNMTPDDYRKKWKLPPNYPMVAPNYARRRSELAKSIGLGRGNRTIPAATEAAEAEPSRRDKPNKPGQNKPGPNKPGQNKPGKK